MHGKSLRITHLFVGSPNPKSNSHQRSHHLQPPAQPWTATCAATRQPPASCVAPAQPAATNPASCAASVQPLRNQQPPTQPPAQPTCAATQPPVQPYAIREPPTQPLPVQSSPSPVMADSLKEVVPAHMVPVPSPVPLYLGGKRKTRWILGKEPKPAESDPKFDEWVSDNCIILGWMFNSMEDRVYHMFMYHDTVHGLWTALTQMYAHARNESRIFELYREVSHASQTSLELSVADFFGYLQTRWEELAQYEPLSDFPSDGAVESKRLDRRHTYQFLMGLKSEFETLRTQILNTSPLPSLYEAFAIVDGDERRHRILPSLSLPESSSIVPDQRAFAAASGTHLYCQHCRKPGHLIDRCWVLHPELKQQFSRPRGGGRGGGRSGGEVEAGAVAEVDSMPANLPDFKQLQLQIAQLQSHLGLATASQSSGPTAAIVAETPTALHGKSGHPTWILDSGANNHDCQGDACLSSDITLSSVYYDLTSKKIFGRGYERDGLYYFGDPLPSILTATYLINRTPSRVLNGKAPLHILQPASTLFPIIPRVFGCTCFVQNRSPTRTKLDDKAVRCIFLGYSSMSKGYRCYDPVTRHMYHSLDVTFLETVLFFSNSTPNPGSEILAADEPIPPRPLPILEPTSPTPTPNGSLSPIASQDPVYVDDIIITGDDASGIVQVKCGLRKAFDIKDLGPLRYFLGIEVARSRHGISLSQRKYSLDLLQDTGMFGCRPASTPMVPNLKISAESGDLLPDPSIYQRLVGVITPSFVPSSAQIADMFTKSIGPSLLKSSLVKLGLVDIFASA
ncbi:hypothetical protein Acr_05g0002890 [Actinidia rufa]|uniref:Reverse transcriptase Ty1/copia-type domain-containing protein n=1 Tax=Actinidia rufa TaxID=165716 RepID=A0A7J0EJU2_9ERIC|nr:hypothetical protein Acr_05g0002890 [Actinidia rufa]